MAMEKHKQIKRLKMIQCGWMEYHGIMKHSGNPLRFEGFSWEKTWFTEGFSSRPCLMTGMVDPYGKSDKTH